MRILFFSPHQIWPINTGARLRNFHLAKALAERCQVTLFQILQPDEELVPAPPSSPPFELVAGAEKTRSYTPGKVLRGMAGPLPLTVLNYSSSAVAQTLDNLLRRRRFDAVQLESSHLFSYLSVIQGTQQPPATLLDWHNIESELMARFANETVSLPKRFVGARTASLLARTEQKLLDLCDAHTVVSEREQAALAARAPASCIQVVPNGVDVSHFAYAETSSPGKDLLFVGSMDYHANIDAVQWFAREVWPGVLQSRPDLRFVIAGRSPSAAVQALASPSVFVTGTVDDVRPLYAQAFAVVVPLLVGGGTRLKILEAMSLGVPVISTRLGAEGIAATDGLNILLADTPRDLGRAIDRVASEPPTRRRLAAAGRKLVTEQYDWNALGDKLFDVHLRLAQARARN